MGTMVVTAALNAASTALKHWRLALIVGLAAWGYYAHWALDGAQAQAAENAAQAEQWKASAQSQREAVAALTRSYERIGDIMDERAAGQQAISERVGSLSEVIEAANADDSTPYGACARVPVDAEIQQSLMQMMAPAEEGGDEGG